MSSSVKFWCAAALAAALFATYGLARAGTTRFAFPGVGRDATPKEVAAWDIDVRPDFKGLPPGSGSVAKGQEVWEGKCAQCHGIFGESGEVFSPLIGGTTADDIRTGHVARLKDQAYPARTMMMQIATVSTIWDFINRAMPWNNPKSLTTEEVYAVTAYVLNLGGVVADDFVLSDRNIADVQKHMPNRNGMTTDHAMWPGPELGGRNRKPDVRNVACMRDCVQDVTVRSSIPDYARDAHGNLAEQNRLIGAQHGVETTKTAGRAPTPAAAKSVVALLTKYGCVGCHAVDRKVLGPAFVDVAKKHTGNVDYLMGKIRAGSSGVWGTFPMPPQQLPDEDLRRISEWLAAGAAH